MLPESDDQKSLFPDGYTQFEVPRANMPPSAFASLQSKILKKNFNPRASKLFQVQVYRNPQTISSLLTKMILTLLNFPNQITGSQRRQTPSIYESSSIVAGYKFLIQNQVHVFD